MHWTRLIFAVIGAWIAASMTIGSSQATGFTSGSPLQDWRKGPEAKAIIVSSALPFVTCAAYMVLVLWLDIHSLATVLKLVPIGVAYWAAATHPYQCGIYQASSGICDPLLDWMARET